MRRRLLAAAVVPFVAGCATADGPPPPRTVVFFTEDSAALDDAARAMIAAAAATARRRSDPVRVLGFAAPPGGAAFNQALSEARARNVADGLRAAGVPAGRIRIEPRGAVPFELVPTESRRVEIAIGG